MALQRRCCAGDPANSTPARCCAGDSTNYLQYSHLTGSANVMNLRARRPEVVNPQPFDFQQLEQFLFGCCPAMGGHSRKQASRVAPIHENPREGIRPRRVGRRSRGLTSGSRRRAARQPGKAQLRCLVGKQIWTGRRRSVKGSEENACAALFGLLLARAASRLALGESHSCCHVAADTERLAAVLTPPEGGFSVRPSGLRS